MPEKLALEEQIEKAQRAFKARHLNISYSELASMYESQELMIAPFYQRQFHWTDNQKARFIESILLGFPVPAIFVVQNAEGIWELVDGMQRLLTVFEFFGVLNNTEGQPVPPLKLSFSEREPVQLSLLNGRTFADLSVWTRLSLQRATC
jgi:hypothetical protein